MPGLTEADLEEFRPLSPLRDRIIEVMADGKVRTADEIGAMVERTRMVVKNAADRLVAEGVLEVGEGKRIVRGKRVYPTVYRAVVKRKGKR